MVAKPSHGMYRLLLKLGQVPPCKASPEDPPPNCRPIWASRPPLGLVHVTLVHEADPPASHADEE